ncbi:hypothetical protein [Parasphingorhabdus sp.]|uniref:hypothetical protein n=1 Tax=Parasphingorhabdus sp. TaxID=2709688 RepID=UPI003A8E1FA0
MPEASEMLGAIISEEQKIVVPKGENPANVQFAIGSRFFQKAALRLGSGDCSGKHCLAPHRPERRV